ncbi:MAG TPA: hypothetical protein VE197_15630 [Mycobacterium sp.]|nr:hypothetical protein [Mycobacterium sp.]
MTDSNGRDPIHGHDYRRGAAETWPVHRHIGSLVVCRDQDRIGILAPCSDGCDCDDCVLLDLEPCEVVSLLSALVRAVGAVGSPGAWALRATQRERVASYLDSGGRAELGVLSATGCPDCGAPRGEPCDGGTLLCDARIGAIVDFVPTDPGDEPDDDEDLQIVMESVAPRSRLHLARLVIDGLVGVVGAVVGRLVGGR